MEKNGNHILHVIASSQAPSLRLTSRQCLIQADVPDLEVGERLFFPENEKTLHIQGITWVLGKLRPVRSTEKGHRYIVEFDDEFVTNIISKNYRFKILF